MAYNLPMQVSLQVDPGSLATVRRQIESSFRGIQVQGLDTQNFAKANAAIENTAKNLNKGEKAAQSFFDAVEGRARGYAAYAIVSTAILKFTNVVSKATREAIKYEAELLKLSQTTGESVQATKAQSQTLLNISKIYNVNATKVAALTRVLAQTGLSFREAAKGAEILARTSLLASFDNLTSTTEGLIAAMQTFNLTVREGGKVLDQINIVSKRFAVESGDIVEAIRRTGGAFSSAGGQIEELIALFTSVRSTTRESAETIATGFRTIFGRLQRPKTIEYFKQLGIQLETAEGQFIGPLQAIEEIGKGLERLGIRAGSVKFAEVVEQIGGIRQISRVIPLLEQYEKTQAALRAQNEASGESARDLEKAQQGLGFQIGVLKQEFTELIQEVIGSDSFKFLAETFINVTRTIITLTKSLKPLLPLLSALLTIKIGRGLTSLISGGFNLKGVKEAVGFASGGMVPGSGNGDTVPAMLTPGEFVIRKSAVKAFGADRLAKINKYASGGYVSAAANDYNIIGASYIPERQAYTFTKDSNKKFEKDKKFNAKDKIKFDIREEQVDVKKLYQSNSTDPLYNKYINEKNASKRGLAFEKIVRDQYPGSFTKSGRGSSYLDGVFNKQPAEIKSNEAVSELKLGRKFLASAIAGNRNSKEASDKLSGDRLQSLALTNKPDTVNLGELILINDVTKGIITEDKSKAASKGATKTVDLGRIQKTKKYQGGLIQKFAEGGIVEDLKRALSTYVEDSSQINKSLSIGTAFGSVENTIKSLDQLFKYNPPSKLYSGFGKNRTFILTGGIDTSIPEFIDLIIGETRTFPGYLSASENMDVADNFRQRGGVLASIKPKAPTIDVRSAAKDLGLSLTNSRLTEEEFILPKQSKFMIEDFQQNDDGVSYAELIQMKTGGLIQQFAKGGSVGIGTDTVPALLTPGEFVINKQSAQSFGYNNLKKINRYAKGGIVQEFVNGGAVNNPFATMGGSMGQKAREGINPFASMTGAMGDAARRTTEAMLGLKKSTNEVADKNKKLAISVAEVIVYQQATVSALKNYLGITVNQDAVQTSAVKAGQFDLAKSGVDQINKENIQQFSEKLKGASSILEKFGGKIGGKFGGIVTKAGGGIAKFGKMLTKWTPMILKGTKLLSSALSIASWVEIFGGLFDGLMSIDYKKMKQQAIERGDVEAAGIAAAKQYNQEFYRGIPIIGSLLSAFQEYLPAVMTELDAKGKLVVATAQLSASMNSLDKVIKSTNEDFDEGLRRGDNQQVRDALSEQATAINDVFERAEQQSVKIAESRKSSGVGGVLAAGLGGAVGGASIGATAGGIAGAAGSAGILGIPAAGVGAIAGAVIGGVGAAGYALINSMSKSHEEIMEAYQVQGEAYEKWGKEQAERINKVGDAMTVSGLQVLKAGGSIEDAFARMKQTFGEENIKSIFGDIEPSAKGLEQGYKRQAEESKKYQKSIQDLQKEMDKASRDVDASWEPTFWNLYQGSKNSKRQTLADLEAQKKKLEAEKQTVDAIKAEIAEMQQKFNLQIAINKQIAIENAAMRERILLSRELTDIFDRLNRSSLAMSESLDQVNAARSGGLSRQQALDNAGITDVSSTTLQMTGEQVLRDEQAYSEMSRAVERLGSERASSMMKETKVNLGLVDQMEKLMTGGQLGKDIAEIRVKAQEEATRSMAGGEEGGVNQEAKIDGTIIADKIEQSLKDSNPGLEITPRLKQALQDYGNDIADGMSEAEAGERLKEKIGQEAVGLIEATQEKYNEYIQMEQQYHEMQIELVQRQSQLYQNVYNAEKEYFEQRISLTEKIEDLFEPEPAGAGRAGFLEARARQRRQRSLDAIGSAREASPAFTGRDTSGQERGVISGLNMLSKFNEAGGDFAKTLASLQQEGQLLLGTLQDEIKAEQDYLDGLIEVAKAQQEYTQALNDAQGDLARELITGTEEEQVDLLNNLNAAMVAAQQGSFAGIPEEMKKGVFSIFDQFGDIEIPGLGMTGRDAQREITKNELMMNWGLDEATAEKLASKTVKDKVPIDERMKEMIELQEKKILELLAREKAMKDALNAAEAMSIMLFSQAVDRFGEAVDRFLVDLRNPPPQENPPVEPPKPKEEPKEEPKEQPTPLPVEVTNWTQDGGRQRHEALPTDYDPETPKDGLTPEQRLANDPQAQARANRAKARVQQAGNGGVNNPYEPNSDWFSENLTATLGLGDWLERNGLSWWNKGGIVYASTGGKMNMSKMGFKPKGTDTVPAMLTPGEYVIRKQAVDQIGIDTLDRINNGISYKADGGYQGPSGSPSFQPKEISIDSLSDYDLRHSHGLQSIGLAPKPEYHAQYPGQAFEENISNLINSGLSKLGLSEKSSINIQSGFRIISGLKGRNLEEIISGISGFADNFDVNNGINTASMSHIPILTDDQKQGFKDLNARANAVNNPGLRAIKTTQPAFFAKGGKVPPEGYMGRNKGNIKRYGWSDPRSEQYALRGLDPDSPYYEQALAYWQQIMEFQNAYNQRAAYWNQGIAAQQMQQAQWILGMMGSYYRTRGYAKGGQVQYLKKGGLLDRIFGNRGTSLSPKMGLSGNVGLNPSDFGTFSDDFAIRLASDFGLDKKMLDQLLRPSKIVGGKEGSQHLDAAGAAFAARKGLRGSFRPGGRVYSSGNILIGRGNYMRADIAQHELGHVMQNNARRMISPKSANILRGKDAGMQDTINAFLKNRGGYNSLMQNYTRGRGGMYTADFIQNKPDEMFTEILKTYGSKAYNKNQGAQDLLREFFNRSGLKSQSPSASKSSPFGQLKNTASALIDRGKAAGSGSIKNVKQLIGNTYKMGQAGVKNSMGLVGRTMDGLKNAKIPTPKMPNVGMIGDFMQGLNRTGQGKNAIINNPLSYKAGRSIGMAKQTVKNIPQLFNMGRTGNLGSGNFNIVERLAQNTGQRVASIGKGFNNLGRGFAAGQGKGFAGISGPMGDAARRTATASSMGKLGYGASKGMQGIGKGIKFGSKILGRLGPVLGAYSGYAAPTEQSADSDNPYMDALSNRNSYLNAAFGALGAGATTMGDVGAQSTLGSMMDVQQGGALDQQLGNFSQLAMGSLQMQAAGVPLPLAALTTAGSMVGQEAIGLANDQSALAATERKTNRMEYNFAETQRKNFEPINLNAQQMILQNEQRIARENMEKFQQAVDEGRGSEQVGPGGLITNEEALKKSKEAWAEKNMLFESSLTDNQREDRSKLQQNREARQRLEQGQKDAQASREALYPEYREKFPGISDEEINYFIRNRNAKGEAGPEEQMKVMRDAEQAARKTSNTTASTGGGLMQIPPEVSRFELQKKIIAKLEDNVRRTEGSLYDRSGGELDYRALDLFNDLQNFPENQFSKKEHFAALATMTEEDQKNLFDRIKREHEEYKAKQISGTKSQQYDPFAPENYKEQTDAEWLAENPPTRLFNPTMRVEDSQGNYQATLNPPESTTPQSVTAKSTSMAATEQAAAAAAAKTPAVEPSGSSFTPTGNVGVDALMSKPLDIKEGKERSNKARYRSRLDALRRAGASGEALDEFKSKYRPQIYSEENQTLYDYNRARFSGRAANAIHPSKRTPEQEARAQKYKDEILAPNAKAYAEFKKTGKPLPSIQDRAIAYKKRMSAQKESSLMDSNKEAMPVDTTGSTIAGALAGTIGGTLGGPVGGAIGSFVGSKVGGLFGQAPQDETAMQAREALDTLRQSNVNDIMANFQQPQVGEQPSNLPSNPVVPERVAPQSRTSNLLGQDGGRGTRLQDSAQSAQPMQIQTQGQQEIIVRLPDIQALVNQSITSMIYDTVGQVFSNLAENVRSSNNFEEVANAMQNGVTHKETKPMEGSK